MKLVTFDKGSRRKLIKTLWALGDEYYFFSDGSSIEFDEAIRSSFEFWPKASLTDQLRVVVADAYDDAMPPYTANAFDLRDRDFVPFDRGLHACQLQKLGYVAATIVACGFILPWRHELPSSQGLLLTKSSLDDLKRSFAGDVKVRSRLPK